MKVDITGKLQSLYNHIHEYEIDCYSIVTSDSCIKYFNATKGDWSFQVKPYREFALLNQIKGIECLSMIFNF